MQSLERLRIIRSGIIMVCTVCAVVGILFSVPAQAAVHFVNLGTGAPPSTIGGIPVVPFNNSAQSAVPDGTSVTSIPGCPAQAHLALSSALIKQTAPGPNWATWSHGYSGPVFSSNGQNSETLTLPPNVRAFYVYIEPANIFYYNVTVTTGSGSTSGPISVTGDHGASGFGFYSDGGAISTIKISADSNALGFALAEFGIAFKPGWAIVTNDGDNDIVTYDLSTNPPTKHGPFLQGQLGGNNGLLNVAVTPDGHYALASNWADDRVYRIDLSDPSAPALDGSLPLPFSPGSIAISLDGSYAIVACGGRGSNQIAVIDMTGFSLKTTYTFQTNGATAAAVAIAPDNKTWVATDVVNNQILYGTYSLASGFSGEQSLPAGSHPVNVSISPDGQTVLVADAGSSEVSVYRIAGPGTLVAEPAVTGLPSGCQSIAFSPDGSRAYVLSETAPCELSWLSVTGPGAVSLGGAGVASLPFLSYSPAIGLDQMAISGDGRTLVFTVPLEYPSTKIALVDASTFVVSTVDTGSSFPVGVATFQADNCPPIAVASTPSPIPPEVAGARIPATRFTASGGTGPYTFSLAGDSSPLPPGLTLSADGTLDGTPATAGTYTFTVAATDADGCPGQQTFTVTIYSLSFFDNGGSAAACVDAATGAYQWTVRSGPFAGMTFTGTLSAYDGGTMFWSQPGASQYVYIYYDPNGHTAWGYLYDYTTGLYSSIYDSDTLDNPAGCGALPAT